MTSFFKGKIMPEVMKTKDDSKPWKGVCVKRCWYALHDTCKCRCKKLNHGKGITKNPERKTEIPKEIGRSQRIDDGSMSLDGGKTTSNRADGKAPWEPYHP